MENDKLSCFFVAPFGDKEEQMGGGTMPHFELVRSAVKEILESFPDAPIRLRRADEIADGVKLAKECPNTRFIIDHCGNMSVTSKDKALRAKWMKGMKEAAALKNTVCKISGIVVTAEKGKWKPADLEPNMSFCMETFGEDRAYFGGDWPVCTLKATFAEWVHALKWITRKKSAAFRKNLFHDNAVRFYGLG